VIGPPLPPPPLKGDERLHRLAVAPGQFGELDGVDPAIVALDSGDVLALSATRPRPTAAYPPVHVRSRIDLYDEHGRDVGGWCVVASVGFHCHSPFRIFLTHA